MARKSTATRKPAAKPAAKRTPAAKAKGSAAARKAWETRRANGWKHPKTHRALTPKEISTQSGVPVAKVNRILALAAKRVPTSG